MPEIRVLKLEKLNPHRNDPRLLYNDETHTYYIDGIKAEISVSGFVHKLFKPFEKEIAIDNILRSRKMTDPTYEYYGLTREQIKEQWIQRADLGTVLHYDIESFYNGEKYSNSTIEFQYFLNFQRDHSYLEPFRTEWRIFSKRCDIAGTIDMLFRDMGGDYIIFDWKRAKEIKMPVQDRFTEYSIIPELSHLIKCNFVEYSIQLNTYKYILETEYGIKVKAMYLCILHPINDNYKLFRVKNMSKEISAVMEKRTQKINFI